MRDQSRIDAIRALRQVGKTRKQIACELGMTTNAVIGFMYRNGIDHDPAVGEAVREAERRRQQLRTARARSGLEALPAPPLPEPPSEPAATPGNGKQMPIRADGQVGLRASDCFELALGDVEIDDIGIKWVFVGWVKTGAGLRATFVAEMAGKSAVRVYSAAMAETLKNHFPALQQRSVDGKKE